MTTKIYVKEGTVIGRVLPIEPKKRAIILNNDDLDKAYFDEHPIQVEVVLTGMSGVSIFVEANTSKEYDIQKGDILYLDRFPTESERLIIEGELYVRVLQGNILCVIKPREDGYAEQEPTADNVIH